jgi:hypothetical protein
MIRNVYVPDQTISTMMGWIIWNFHLLLIRRFPALSYSSFSLRIRRRFVRLESQAIPGALTYPMCLNQYSIVLAGFITYVIEADLRTCKYTILEFITWLDGIAITVASEIGFRLKHFRKFTASTAPRS